MGEGEEEKDESLVHSRVTSLCGRLTGPHSKGVPMSIKGN